MFSCIANSFFTQLMELLMTPDRIPALWYELDAFLNTLPDGPILEPLLCRAAEFRVTFMIHELSPLNDKDRQSSCIAIRELIDCGLALAQDLQNAADALTHRHGTRSHPSSSFSGYITISSAANTDIASCLYLTVRLHVQEMVSKLGDTGFIDCSPRQPDTTASAAQLLMKTSGVLDSRTCREKQGLGSQAFSLFWPLAAVLQSTLASEEEKVLAKKKLVEVGNLSGFGLALMHSKRHVSIERGDQVLIQGGSGGKNTGSSFS
jgi:hypothetical protein